MNTSMYLVAVLAFCALPSALGLMCYKCTANDTTKELCTNMSTYTTVNCTGASAQCARTEIMTVGVPLKAYILDCVDEPANCSSYNMTLCNTVMQGARDKNATISSCMTTCCPDKDTCLVPTEPPTTPTGTSTDSGDGTMTSTTAAADVFRPHTQLLALLFIILAVVGAQ